MKDSKHPLVTISATPRVFFLGLFSVHVFFGESVCKFFQHVK